MLVIRPSASEPILRRVVLVHSTRGDIHLRIGAQAKTNNYSKTRCAGLSLAMFFFTITGSTSPFLRLDPVVPPPLL